MTTPENAALYAAQHAVEWNGRPFAVFNPHDRPLAELPVIYGFNNGGPSDFLHAALLAQDGVFLGSHICSHETYMYHDLGIVEGSRPDRHETFRLHYPDGYRMTFVPRDETWNADGELHPGLAAAYKLHEERGKALEGKGT